MLPCPTLSLKKANNFKCSYVFKFSDYCSCLAVDFYNFTACCKAFPTSPCIG